MNSVTNLEHVQLMILLMTPFSYMIYLYSILAVIKHNDSNHIWIKSITVMNRSAVTYIAWNQCFHRVSFVINNQALFK